jgi:hypothetical protein
MTMKRRFYRFAFRFFAPLRFFGTLAPAARASESPIAIACLRLLTLRPERPLLNLPDLRSRIARPTLLDAFFEYLRAMIISPGGEKPILAASESSELRLIRRPQAIADAGFGQHELGALRIGFDLLPELAHIDP